MILDEAPVYAPKEGQASPLFSLLLNTVVLCHTAPHLPIGSLLSLGGTNKAFRDLVHHTPGVFRHLDLTPVKSARFEIEAIDHGGETWRNVQLDENLTEDDFYSGPLRGVFGNLRRRTILKNVQTLILDGLAVTAELCHEIITDPGYNVKILSLRDAKHLNEAQLRGALQYACRGSRADGTPTLKGLYIFTTLEAVLPVSTRQVTSQCATVGAGWNQKSHQALKEALRSEGESWYVKKGRIVNRKLADDWANTLLACQVYGRPQYGRLFGSGNQRHCALATYGLGGCATCGSAPEGLTAHGSSPTNLLPLLAPPSLHSSTIKAATHPQPSTASRQSFVARCAECIRDRYCASCHVWWCENCYYPPEEATNTIVDPILVMPDGTAVVEYVETTPKAKVRKDMCERCRGDDFAVERDLGKQCGGNSREC